MATDIKVNAKFKEFEHLTIHLRNQKSTVNENINLHKHITSVMNHIVIHCPAQALDKLEEISYLIKNNDTLAIEDFLKVNENNVYAQPVTGDATQSNKIIEESQKLFQVQTTKDDDGNEVPVEAGPIGFIPDLIGDSKTWQWANISFGEYDLMLLQKSLKKLAFDKKMTSLRLWGKIKGTKADYFIVESTMEAGEGDGVEGIEPRGQAGVNKFVYFASNCPTKDWYELPDLKPQDILNARSIRYTFTGDLECQIYTNPFYYEKEKVYLRAQICRINQSTQLTAKSLYKLDAENPREIVENVAEGDDPPIPKPKNQDMKSQEMWVHQSVTLLKQGRLAHKIPPPEGEEDPEETAKREIAKDPWAPRLEPITSDKKTRGGMPAWVIRGYQTDQQFLDLKTKAATENYGCVVAKSMLWPGSFNFYVNGRVSQIYCGDGLKHEDVGVTFYPIIPPVMMSDAPEKKCYKEPNPTEEYMKAKAEAEAKKAAAAEQPEGA